MALNTVILSFTLSNSGILLQKLGPLFRLPATGPCLACHAFFSGEKSSNQSVPASGNTSLQLCRFYYDELSDQGYTSLPKSDEIKTF